MGGLTIIDREIVHTFKGTYSSTYAIDRTELLLLFLRARTDHRKTQQDHGTISDSATGADVLVQRSWPILARSSQGRLCIRQSIGVTQSSDVSR